MNLLSINPSAKKTIWKRQEVPAKGEPDGGVAVVGDWGEKSGVNLVATEIAGESVEEPKDVVMVIESSEDEDEA